MPDNVEIRLLRNFVAVAEELHFSRAAQRLFLAQQVLSRDIQRLEERMGVRLLERTTRRSCSPRRALCCWGGRGRSWRSMTRPCWNYAGSRAH